MNTSAFATDTNPTRRLVLDPPAGTGRLTAHRGRAPDLPAWSSGRASPSPSSPCAVPRFAPERVRSPTPNQVRSEEPAVVKRRIQDQQQDEGDTGRTEDVPRPGAEHRQ